MAQNTESFFNKLNKFRNDGEFCDIELVVNETKFPAHRDILRTSSVYFENLFMGIDRNEKSVVICSMDPNIFKTLLDFIYTRYLNVGQNSLQDLLEAGIKLELSEVIDECCSRLCDQMGVSNVIDTLNFAERNKIEKLTKSAFDFIESNFSLIAIGDVLQLIISERISTPVGFETIVRWVNHDVDDRLKYVDEIFTYFPISTVDIDKIDQTIDNCSNGALKVFLLGMRANLAQQQNLPQRHIYIFDCLGSKSKWLIKYDIVSEESEYMAPHKLDGAFEYVFGLNDKIYCWNSKRSLQYGFHIYCSKSNEWTYLEGHHPNIIYAMCESNGRIWALADNRMHCYDPVTNIWTSMSESSIPTDQREIIRMISFEGNIYITYHESGCEINLTSYNPVTGTWNNLASSSIKRSYYGLVFLNRHLYVVGGGDWLVVGEIFKSVDRYSVDTNMWDCAVPDMIENHEQPAVASINGLLYVIGGGDDPKIASVEYFDPKSNKWNKCLDLKKKIEWPIAVVL